MIPHIEFYRIYENCDLIFKMHRMPGSPPSWIEVEVALARRRLVGVSTGFKLRDGRF